jgi:hypothetical protein
MEIYFKVKRKGAKEFRSEDIDASSEMKNVFLTFSPILIR